MTAKEPLKERFFYFLFDQIRPLPSLFSSAMTKFYSEYLPWGRKMAALAALSAKIMADCWWIIYYERKGEMDKTSAYAEALIDNLRRLIDLNYAENSIERVWLENEIKKLEDFYAYYCYQRKMNN